MKTYIFPLMFMMFLGSLCAQPTLDPETGRIPRPDTRPILQVSGDIEITSDGKTAYMSYEQLKTFPQHTVEIKKPWFDRERVQSGPLLRDVLHFLKAKGDNIKAVAYNDYHTSIPVSDAYKFPIVLAIDLVDKPMPVREMGPIFITYPLSTDPTLRKELYYSRSVWQVKTLTIE
ncbi:MAG: hypothetical protein ACPGN3_04060 [Opitutales bacterium]